MSIIGDGIMLGAGGESASILVSGVSETDTVTAVQKIPTQVPNPEWKNLPDGYTQLEYIESTGTQYINTEFSPSANGYIAKGKFTYSNLNNDWCMPLGIYAGSTTGSGEFGRYYNTSNWATCFGGANNQSSDTFELNVEYVFDASFISGNHYLNINGVDVIKTTQTQSMKSIPVWLFSCNYNGSFNSSESFEGKIYYTEIYDHNNTLNRNFIPAKRNSDSAIGMYDLVTSTFFSNSGTGTFVAGEEIPQYVEEYVDGKTISGKWVIKPNPALHGLPDGYTELDYIQSTGTQYIDTGIFLNPLNGFEIDCKFSTLTSGVRQLMFGNYRNGNEESINVEITAADELRYYAKGDIGSYTNVLTGEIYNVHVEYNNSTKLLSFSSELGSASATKSYTTAFTSKMRLFLDNRDNPTATFGSEKIRMYRYSVSVGGTYIQNLIPCKRNSDNTIGMYDLVSGTFYTNAGTGTFTAGVEVSQTIDGFLIDKIKSYGTWTITATDGVQTATQDVLVDSAVEYNVSISYVDARLQLWLNGSGYTDESIIRNTVTNYGTSFITSGDFPYYAFDGSSHYIQFSSQTINPNDFSISFWGYFDGNYQWERFFDFGEGVAKDLWCAHFQTSGNLAFEYKFDSTSYTSSRVSFSSGAWHHIALRGTNGTTTMYVDGASVTSVSNPSVDTLSLTNCYLGKSNWDADSYLHGKIADFRLYNTAITEEEIIELYHSGAYVPN